MFQYHYSSNDTAFNCYDILIRKFAVAGVIDQSRFIHLQKFNLIDITFSDESPNNKEAKEIEKPDYDNVLGIFRLDRNDIVLYYSTISYFAQKYSISTSDLTVLVILHELGHWASYNMFKLDKTWNKDLFNESDTFVHELLAQLYTRFIIDSFDKPALTKAFATLTQNQSPEYQTYLGFPDIPFSEFVNCNRQLLQLNRKAECVDVGNILETYIVESLNKDDLNRIERCKKYITYFKNKSINEKYGGIFTAGRYGII
jgi:hypothetical protein